MNMRKMIRKQRLTGQQAARLIGQALIDRLPEKLRDDAAASGGISADVEFEPEIDGNGMVAIDLTVEIYRGKE